MSNDIKKTGFNQSTEIDNLRRLNQATVEKFLHQEWEKQWELFAEDGSVGLETPENCKPEEFRVQGIKNLKPHFEGMSKVFPEWKFTNLKIYQTQDPNQFWVECDGGGRVIFPAYPKATHHSCHFILSFLMEKGKIKQWREFMNPCKEMLDVGIEVPIIKRPLGPQS